LAFILKGLVACFTCFEFGAGAAVLNILRKLAPGDFTLFGFAISGNLPEMTE